MLITKLSIFILNIIYLLIFHFIIFCIDTAGPVVKCVCFIIIYVNFWKFIVYIFISILINHRIWMLWESYRDEWILVLFQTLWQQYLFKLLRQILLPLHRSSPFIIKEKWLRYFGNSSFICGCVKSGV